MSLLAINKICIDQSAALPVDLNDPNVVLEEFSQINNMSEKKKKKKKRQPHTRENTKDLRGSAFGLHPRAATRRKFH